MQQLNEDPGIDSLENIGKGLNFNWVENRRRLMRALKADASVINPTKEYYAKIPTVSVPTNHKES